MADIYTELQQDHQELLRIFFELDERGANPNAAFPALYHRLFAHLGAEQDTLYEELLTAQPSREPALRGFVEHRMLTSLLNELAPGDPYDERWRATLTVLRATFGRHVAEEEGPLFDIARRVVSDARAQDLGARYVGERERHMRLALFRG